MNVSFKTKLFVAFFIYGISLVVLTQFSLFKVEELAPKYKASQIFTEKNKIHTAYMKDAEKKLLDIKNSYALNKYLTTKKEKHNIETLFLDITEASNKIFKIRYIDTNLKERISVERDLKNSNPHLKKLIQISNKKNIKYLKSIIKSKDNKVFYSKLGCSQQHRKDIVPIIHLATPIYIKDKKVGILLIDLFMKDFLYELVKSDSSKIYIFDNTGNTLVDADFTNSWSKHLNKNSTLKTYYGAEAKQIIDNPEYYGKDFYASKIHLKSGELLYMVIVPHEYNIKEAILNNYKQIGLFVGILILLSLPMAFLFAKFHSKQKKEDDKHKYNQDVLLSLFDLSDVVLFKWNNDEKWTVDSVSKSVFKLLGYTQEEFETNKINYVDCIHPDDIKQVTQEHFNSISYRAYYFEHKPYRLIKKNADIKWIMHSTVIVKDDDNNIINFVGYLTDITELKNTEIELKEISRTDRLTKINNRLYTDDILENQFYRYKRDEEVCSVILVDIDHFKSVNDNHGHLVGDNVLVEFARLLNISIRKGDVLGRWGGEEFLIILPHTQLKEAMKLGEKLRKIINENEFPTIGQMSASFGVSTFVEHSSVDILIDTADKALYESKRNGRNCVTTIQTVKV